MTQPPPVTCPCGDLRLPGERVCADHFIAAALRRAEADVARAVIGRAVAFDQLTDAVVRLALGGGQA